MATRDKPLKDLVGVWPIFGYKFWIQILHSDLERGDRSPLENYLFAEVLLKTIKIKSAPNRPVCSKSENRDLLGKKYGT